MRCASRCWRGAPERPQSEQGQLGGTQIHSHPEISQQQKQLQVTGTWLAGTHRRVLPHHHGLYEHQQLWHPHVGVGANEVLPPALPGASRAQRPMLPLWSLHMAARDRRMGRVLSQQLVRQTAIELLYARYLTHAVPRDATSWQLYRRSFKIVADTARPGDGKPLLRGSAERNLQPLNTYLVGCGAGLSLLSSLLKHCR